MGLTDLMRRWTGRPRCKHRWRPVLVRFYPVTKPARQCQHCRTWEPLSDAEFYAQFGETFFLMTREGRTR